MSELRTLNAVFSRLRRRMLSAQLSTGTVVRRNVGNGSQPERPRLPIRALGEYVPGGGVDAMRRLILRGR